MRIGCSAVEYKGSKGLRARFVDDYVQKKAARRLFSTFFYFHIFLLHVTRASNCCKYWPGSRALISPMKF